MGKARSRKAQADTAAGQREYAVTVISPSILTAGILGLVTLSVGIFLARTAGVWLVVLLAGVSVVLLFAVLALGVIGVNVDARGLKIRSRLLGFSLKTVPPGRIREVSAEKISPLDWGGWGFRLSGGNTAYIIRGRAALRVQLKSGKAVLVTVPSPAVPASILRSFLQASA